MNFKILGTSDITTCDHCGRRGLKLTRVMVPRDADGNADGEVFYAGTSCAASLAGVTSRKITELAEVADFQHAQRVEWAQEKIDTYAAAVEARQAGGRLAPFWELYRSRNTHDLIAPLDAFNDVLGWLTEARSILDRKF